MSDKYVLFGRVPIKVGDVFEWARWFDANKRRVGRTEICDHTVSTVFLGIDHNFTSEGPPILFETAVFGPDDEVIDMLRCATYEQAEAQHEQVVAEWREKLESNDGAA